jgi:hypothetical protein
MTARATLAVLVVACGAAGCAGGASPQAGSTVPATTLARAAPTTTTAPPVSVPEPPPPPPTILESLDASCRTSLAARDRADWAGLRPLLATERQVASMRATIRSLRNGLEADRGGITSNGQVAAFNARVDAFNARIYRLNRIAASGERASRRLARLEKRRHVFLLACLKRIEGAVWGDAARATELAAEQAARSVGRRDPVVTCETPAYAQTTVRSHGRTWDLYGYVFAGSNVIHLSPVECFALEQVRTRSVSVDCVRHRPVYNGACPGAQADAAAALITIAHEQQHVDGIRSEARAECQAFQLVFRIGPEFGIAPASARLLGPYTHATISQPPGYRSKRCGAGKPWDLHAAPGWPRYTARA